MHVPRVCEHVWVIHECTYAHIHGDWRLKLAIILDPSRQGLLVKPTAHQYSYFYPQFALEIPSPLLGLN